MSVHRVLLVVCSVLLIATTGSAGSKPVTVSPGSATGALIGDACPTFSWGSVEGAKRYELVVYRLGEEGEEPEPVLRETFAGSVSGWTPSLDRCLERGGQYAWSVRAVGQAEASEWSPPSLFQVTAPTEAEFEEAVAVVRRYLDDGSDTVRQEARGPEARPPVNALATVARSQAQVTGPEGGRREVWRRFGDCDVDLSGRKQQ